MSSVAIYELLSAYAISCKQSSFIWTNLDLLLVNTLQLFQFFGFIPKTAL